MNKITRSESHLEVYLLVDTMKKHGFSANRIIRLYEIRLQLTDLKISHKLNIISIISLTATAIKKTDSNICSIFSLI